MVLIKRGCVQCPEVSPPCECAADEECRLSAQSCDVCAIATCRKQTKKTHDSTGAIVGGIIGGLAAIALIGLLVWFFMYRKRQSQRGPKVDGSSVAGVAPADAFKARAPSIVTVDASQARGSNIIPIAYMPGLANQEMAQNAQYVPIRNSVAPSYRASLNENTVAVQGHPHLIQLNLSRRSSHVSTKATRLHNNPPTELPPIDEHHFSVHFDGLSVSSNGQPAPPAPPAQSETKPEESPPRFL